MLFSIAQVNNRPLIITLLHAVLQMITGSSVAEQEFELQHMAPWGMAEIILSIHISITNIYCMKQL